MVSSKNISLKIALGIVCTAILISFLAPWISTEMPLYAKYKNQNIFPAFSKNGQLEIKDKEGRNQYLQYRNIDWKKIKLDQVIWAPITYDPGKSDPENFNYVSPFQKQFFKGEDNKLSSMPLKFRHWLGTGKRGDDVLAGMIHGTSISIAVGFFSVLLAALIGILIGATAGYLGNKELKISFAKTISISLGIFIAFFYAIYLRIPSWKMAFENSSISLWLQILFSLLLITIIIFISIKTSGILSGISFFRKEITLPADHFLSRIIEVVISIPRLLLILSFAAIMRPSIFSVVLIIGLTSWTSIARLVRAEFLKIKNMDYIQWCKSSGYSSWRIMLFHALPNAIINVWPAFIFNIATAILIESSLSFLGIGLPPETVSWGSLISNGNDNMTAWWLILFPGIAILLLILSLYLLSEKMGSQTIFFSFQKKKTSDYM